MTVTFVWIALAIIVVALLVIVGLVLTRTKRGGTTQAPPQPTNDEPVAAAAFKASKVPVSNRFEQVAPQLMPAGVEVTVPLPVPCLVTVIAIVGEGGGALLFKPSVGPLSAPQPVKYRTQKQENKMTAENSVSDTCLIEMLSL